MPPKFGGGEKCKVCEKTVYASDRCAVETKDETVVMHKLCFRCAKEGCNKRLELTSYAAHDGSYYCKSCLKYLAAENSGDLDAATGRARRRSGNFTAQPASFLPSGAVESTSVKRSDAEMSDKAKAMRGKFGGGASNKCPTCALTVYASEQVVVEAADGTSNYFHKACLKCKECQALLRQETLVQVAGDIFCKTHGKEASAKAAANKGAYSEGGSEKAKAIASKIGSAAEKCGICDQSVYSTEKLVIERVDGTDSIHKACFKCSECNSALTLGKYVYDKSSKKYFCKPHAPKGEMVRDAGAFADYTGGSGPSTGEMLEQNGDNDTTSSSYQRNDDDDDGGNNNNANANADDDDDGGRRGAYEDENEAAAAADDGDAYGGGGDDEDQPQEEEQDY